MKVTLKQLYEVLKSTKHLAFSEGMRSGTQAVLMLFAVSRMSAEELSYGVYALLIMNVSETIGGLGIRRAISRVIDMNGQTLVSCWTFNLLRAIIVGILIFLLSRPLLQIFALNLENMVWIIQICAIYPLLVALQNPGLIQSEQRLDFSPHKGMSFVGGIVHFFSGIALVFVYQAGWALPISRLLGTISESVMSYWRVSRPEISLRWNWGEVEPIFSYGKRVCISDSCKYLATNLDTWFVSIFFGPSFLGIYKVGYDIGTFPASRFLGKVILPFHYIEQAKSNRSRVRSFLGTPLISVGLASVFALSIGLGLEPGFALLNIKHDMVKGVAAIFLFSVPFRCWIDLKVNQLEAHGNAYTSVKIQLTQIFVLLLVVYPLGQSYGIYGVATACFIAILCQFPAIYALATDRGN